MRRQGGIEGQAVEAPCGARPLAVVIADIDRVLTPDDPHAGQRQGVASPGGIGQAEEMQLLGDPRTGVLGAGLGAWMCARLDQQHIAPLRGKGRGHRGPSRPRPDHQHIALEPRAAHRYTVVTRGQNQRLRETRRRPALPANVSSSARV